MRVLPDGNIVIAGTLMEGSSRGVKTGLHEILETRTAELARYAERVQALEARIAELERLIEESSRQR